MLKDIFIGFLKDLFFPAFCLKCGLEGSFVCDKCFKSLQKMMTDRQISIPKNSPLDGIVTVYKYEDHSLPARLIHSFKYDLIKELYRPLGRLMAERMNELLYLSGVVLCPVPLHKKRFKWRGFNQSDLLAKRVGTICGIGVIYPLKRIHFRIAQMELKREDRVKNIRGAFVIDKNFGEAMLSLSGKSVFLVDDVATTLSTLNECALTLKNAGCKKVYAIVLARVC